MTEQKYWCYILYNTKEEYKGRTYVGFTVEPARRIRQHNRELVGGAKCTAQGAGGWEFLAILTGFQTSNNALSCEYRLKHPDGKKRKNKKYNGVIGRILSLNEVLQLPKWSSKCDILNSDCQYSLYVLEDVYDKLDLENIPCNVTCNVLATLGR